MLDALGLPYYLQVEVQKSCSTPGVIIDSGLDVQPDFAASLAGITNFSQSSSTQMVATTGLMCLASLAGLSMTAVGWQV